MKPGFIYILTNYTNSTLYIGVTSNLPQRIIEHKEKKILKSFSSKYNLTKLVYYEQFQMIGDAIRREKQLKAGSRAKKIPLIESVNLDWKDYVVEDPRYLRPTEVSALVGDPTKAKKLLGWSAKTHWRELAVLMVDADIKKH